MDLNEYQRLTSTTAVYNVGATTQQSEEAGVVYCAVALCGESGELANKVKKILRRDKSLIEQAPALVDELGDVLWYVAQFAECLGINLEEVARLNLQKLAMRKAKGTIHGEGDQR